MPIPQSTSASLIKTIFDARLHEKEAPYEEDDIAAPYEEDDIADVEDEDDDISDVLPKYLKKHGIPLSYFEEKAKEYSGMIDFFTRSFNVAGYGHEEKRNIVLALFAKALDRHNPDKGPFKGFAQHVIRNGLIDLYSKEKRYSDTFTTTLDTPVGGGEDDEEDETSYKDTISDPEDLASTSVATKEVSELLKKLVSQLPDDEAHVLTLRYGLGGKDPMTLRDIAKEQMASPTGVMMLINRATKRLKTRIEAMGIDMSDLAEADSFLRSADELSSIIEHLNKLPSRIISRL